MMNTSKALSWTLVLLWMAVIFGFSHQPATVSSGMSSGITETIINAISQISSRASIDTDAMHTFVRKNAHFFVYLILGVLVFRALRKSGVRGYRGGLAALAICALYAMSDEFHQLFIPGRSGEIRDVLIDSTGAFVGIGLALGLTEWRKAKNWAGTKARTQEAGR